MKRIVMLAVLALAACGGSDGDGGGGTGGAGGEGPTCVLPEGMECHAWWPDWPDRTREGTFCLPPDDFGSYQCWWIERSPRCDPGDRTAVYFLPDIYEYEEVCVGSGVKPSCTVAGGQGAQPKYDAITHTPIECLRPWDA